jgi:hypothetical protein
VGDGGGGWAAFLESQPAGFEVWAIFEFTAYVVFQQLSLDLCYKVITILIQTYKADWALTPTTMLKELSKVSPMLFVRGIETDKRSFD